MSNRSNDGSDTQAVSAYRDPKELFPVDVAFLKQVAGQVAIAIENALAYAQIAELKDKLALEELYLAKSCACSRKRPAAWAARTARPPARD